MQVRLLAGLMIALPTGAHAESAAVPGENSFRLSWSAPASCPAESEVRQRIQRLLNESKLPPPATPLEVSAQVKASPEGFHLDLAVGSPPAARSRKLLAPSCGELAHATALVVALAIDPSLAAIPDAESDATTFDAATKDAGAAPDAPSSPPRCVGVPEFTACEVPDSPTVLPAPALSPATPKRESIDDEVRTPKKARFFALLGGSGVAFGALPQALPRVTLGAVYRRGVHWLELSANGAFGVEEARADGTGASFLLAFAEPRYCGRMAAAFGTLGACGLFELGASRASGFGVDYPSAQWSAWFAPGIGVAASVPLASGAELSLMGDLLWVVTRTRFELDGVLRYRPNALVPAVRLVLAAGM